MTSGFMEHSLTPGPRRIKWEERRTLSNFHPPAHHVVRLLDGWPFFLG
jgi:hypothetical protein